jgi:hypothetical protein
MNIAWWHRFSAPTANRLAPEHGGLLFPVFPLFSGTPTLSPSQRSTISRLGFAEFQPLLRAETEPCAPGRRGVTGQPSRRCGVA